MENSISNLEIVGWVALAACMALLIIPAAKVIIRILKICGKKMDHYTINEFTSYESKNEGKYLEKLSTRDQSVTKDSVHDQRDKIER